MVELSTEKLNPDLVLPPEALDLLDETGAVVLPTPWAGSMHRRGIRYSVLAIGPGNTVRENYHRNVWREGGILPKPFFAQRLALAKGQAEKVAARHKTHFGSIPLQAVAEQQGQPIWAEEPILI